MTKPVCENCGSDDLHMNLLARYNAEVEVWLIEHRTTEVVCNVCCVEQEKQEPRFVGVQDEFVRQGVIT
tara:strand:+ start:309 stop:515 length:207 start_codon:yes stop_codon:yes gene_type:complete